MRTPRHDVVELSTGYSASQRRLEVASIIVFWFCIGGITLKAWPVAVTSPWLSAAALMSGYLMADFISGFVHWLADTWGHPDMPWLGKALIRPFREHHIDQKAITRHDYIETNGNNCLISVPVAFMAWALPLTVPGWRDPALFLMLSLTSMIFWVMMTNQFHKWSHASPEQLPKVVATLQRLHFILPADHHQIHHRAPYETHYCITTGWLNWPLAKFGFFRLLERLVTAVTGAIPRKDDLGLAAALQTMPEPVGHSTHSDVAVRQ
jgi:plasmanylethanolamine desaturase